MRPNGRKRKPAACGAPSQLRSQGQPAKVRPRRCRPKPQPHPAGCRVEGCREPLKPGYHQKYRICATHGGAPELHIDGRTVRWCQQCGRFHDLKVFWGTQRSCRDSLLRHQQRRQRRLGQLGAGPAAPAAEAMEQPHYRPVERQHTQQQNSSETHSTQAEEPAPLPASSSSGHSGSASAAVSLPAAMPAQQLLPPWSPTGPPLPAARAAAFARAAALASQQPELWEPIAPLTPAVLPERPDCKAHPLPAATPMPSPAAAVAAAAAATPMPPAPEQQLLPQQLDAPWPQQLDAPWPPVRLAASNPAPAVHWPQQAPQCTWPLPHAGCPQPQQPQQQQPLGCATWLPGLQHEQPRHPPLLPPLPETACWPRQHAEQREPQPQHLDLPCWAHCSGSGCSSGRNGSPCLPYFDANEIEALVEILHPPSLDPPIPELLAEALACAAGAVPCRAAGAAAPAAPPTLSHVPNVPAGLCGAAPCDRPAPAPSPLLSAAAVAGDWAGNAAEWQHQHRHAASPAPLCCLAGGAGKAEAELQASCWEWPEELFGVPALPCPPSPAMSWLA